MRRGVGVSAVVGKKAAESKFKEKKSNIDENAIDEVSHFSFDSNDLIVL